MKVVLAILLAFSVTTAMAQTDDGISDGDANDCTTESSFFGKMFGRSKACLESMLKQLEGDFEAYKIDSNTKIENLQRIIGENKDSIKKTESEFGERISTNEKTFSQNLTELETEATKNYQEIDEQYKNIKATIKDLQHTMGATTTNLEAATADLGEQIENTAKASSNYGESIEDIKKTTDESLEDVNKAVSQNKAYWLISTLVIALVLLLIYVIFRKSVNRYRRDAIEENQETRRALEEESVQLDNKLIEMIETQLSIVKSNNADKGNEQDHSLALKVADEIVRIQKNMSRMDKATKGLKQLAASVKRIQDNFSSNGYEIVEMLGKQYNEGMKLSANFIPDEDLDEGQQIITRIIKPQVNYQDIMIQAAQIEVSIGE